MYCTTRCESECRRAKVIQTHTHTTMEPQIDVFPPSSSEHKSTSIWYLFAQNCMWKESSFTQLSSNSPLIALVTPKKKWVTCRCWSFKKNNSQQIETISGAHQMVVNRLRKSIFYHTVGTLRMLAIFRYVVGKWRSMYKNSPHFSCVRSLLYSWIA